MKIKNLRLFLSILIIVVSLCLMSSCSGSTPSVSEMEQDYIGSGITMTIENPFTGEDKIEYFEITSFECEKTQTTEWGFDAFCIASFSNEYYEFTKNVTLHYTKYDGNVYEFSGFEESNRSYSVIANPYAIEDCTERMDFEEYDEIKDRVIVLEEYADTLGWMFTRISKFPNATIQYIHKGNCHFNGEEWDYEGDRTITNIDWHIEGKWIDRETEYEHVHELVISDFDADSESISGYIIMEQEGKIEFSDALITMMEYDYYDGSSVWLGDYSVDGADLYFTSSLGTGDIVEINVRVDSFYVHYDGGVYYRRGSQTLYKE